MELIDINLLLLEKNISKINTDSSYELLTASNYNDYIYKKLSKEEYIYIYKCSDYKIFYQNRSNIVYIFKYINIKKNILYVDNDGIKYSLYKDNYLNINTLTKNYLVINRLKYRTDDSDQLYNIIQNKLNTYKTLSYDNIFIDYINKYYDTIHKYNTDNKKIYDDNFVFNNNFLISVDIDKYSNIVNKLKYINVDYKEEIQNNVNLLLKNIFDIGNKELVLGDNINFKFIGYKLNIKFFGLSFDINYNNINYYRYNYHPLLYMIVSYLTNSNKFFKVLNKINLLLLTTT